MGSPGFGLCDSGSSLVRYSDLLPVAFAHRCTAVLSVDSLGEDPDSVRILPTRPSASSWWGIPAAVVWRSSGAQASGTTSRLEGDLHTNT
ncbi:hypothetical protein [Proteus mirabilis]|uniref:hypothetical protein n=1 Tax=Proteus mirabilis TaxID=584 RepID=UPI004032FA75